MTAALRHELQVYERHLPTLLETHGGEFVVIKGESLEHFTPDLESALTWGYDKFGFEHFFVKQIAEDQGAVHLSKDTGLCL